MVFFKWVLGEKKTRWVFSGRVGFLHACSGESKEECMSNLLSWATQPLLSSANRTNDSAATECDIVHK